MTAQDAICRLLDLYGPSVIVTRRSEKSSTTVHATLATVAVIRAQARRRAREIRRFYSQLGCTTKHEITSLIAEWFEELSWKVPHKREAWQPEYYHTAIFDAAAVGVFFLSKNESIAA
ncbi:MAG: hypothetical protein ACRD1C_11875 [Terriglobales bacterium]